MLKCLVCASGTAVRVSAATASAAHRSLPLVASGPTLCAHSSATTRPFARSLWMTSSGTDGASSSVFGPKLFGSKIPRPSAALHGRRGLRTEGDKEFADYLSTLLSRTWDVGQDGTGRWERTVNGTEAKLTRLISGDEVTVTFNRGQQKSEICRLNFVVEVTKRSASPKHSLVFDCRLLFDWQVGASPGRPGDAGTFDVFDIRKVGFQPEGDADWRETRYDTDTLDWRLHLYLMDLLADRGVDHVFAEELAALSDQFSSSVQFSDQYVSFLEQLGAFVKCN